ncbi:MAG: type II toxin-antitoxin system RelE/ParE family toxin [Clostridiaceae bacterium]|jgi:putative addiction module killer protein|nr:type II toxin-antitoxin system RelE/ParE family toxin [Clostridiaceae bacterium]
MNKYEIEIYETLDGKEPFTIWYQSIKDLKTKIRIDKRIDRIQEGNFGDYKAISQDLYELRLTFGSGYRIYYTVENNKLVMLLVGGDKGSQSSDIQKAKSYLKEYKENK